LHNIEYGKIGQYGQLILCPRNGYVNNIAISNLNTYFNIYPEIAKQEGFYPIVRLENITDKPIEFKLINNKIYEIIVEEED
jgi:hypothetical protein